MLDYFRALWKVLFCYKGYKPQPVTLGVITRWISQFPRPHRYSIMRLLDYIIYLTEKSTIHHLVKLNRQILESLASDGVGPERVIYVSLDKAGSSSPVMLNLLRDAENLERRGAKLVDSRDTHRLTDFTGRVKSGAIVYVDDFSGTGKQFRRSRDWAAQFVVGTFSEFFLVPVICEEAFRRISEAGVVPITSLVHTTKQRPLHSSNTTLSGEIKKRLVALCKEISSTAGLGFGELATMVIFYRNAPNTTPLILRGSLGQSPFKGIFPRSDDLPIEDYIGPS